MVESELNLGDGQIPFHDRVFRIALNSQRARDNKLIPSTSCFSLNNSDKENDYSLSVDWEKMTTAEDCIIRVGCSFKRETGIFKDYRTREIYALDVSFLTALSQVEKVISTPLINNPPIFGRPDNPAHSSICFKRLAYDEAEPELILKIRDHAKDKIVEFDMTEVEKKVEGYRSAPF